jgi:hydroxymethylpyrimidine/phosphomethylpyrimidine kinase
MKPWWSDSQSAYVEKRQGSGRHNINTRLYEESVTEHVPRVLIIAAAGAIRELGPENVVVKGRHLEGVAADVLYDCREFTEFRAERIDTKNTHGTGCIFASAIAANLANGKIVRESVTLAKDFITAAINGSLAIGKGYGPANPMALLYHQAR